jgi:hypothetical protein
MTSFSVEKRPGNIFHMAELAVDFTDQFEMAWESHLAKILGVNQAAVSKLERRADMYVSTLQGFA